MANGKNTPNVTKRGHVDASRYQSMPGANWDTHGSSKGRGKVTPYGGKLGPNTKRAAD